VAPVPASVEWPGVTCLFSRWLEEFEYNRLGSDEWGEIVLRDLTIVLRTLL